MAEVQGARTGHAFGLALESEFAKLKKAVTAHAESEENDEFPTLDSGRSPQQRKELGEQFLETFKSASDVD